MRVPISWLRELVTVEASTAEIADRLTMAGIEVEAIEPCGAYHPQVVVGAIASVERIGQREVFRVQVDVGRERIDVVSGAPNVSSAAAGSKVAVALPGAVVIEPEPPFRLRTIGAATLYGVTSGGAICSARELGVGDDHSGVMFLPKGADVGASIIGALPLAPGWLADEVLVLSILPSTARCLAMVGVAREVSALLGGSLRADPPVADIAITKGELDPVISAPSMCRRFNVARVDGITSAPSPEWLVRRLALCGVGTINAVVDVLNYVMFELGQPMHAYDAERLPGLRLEARAIRGGERMRTLAQQDTDEPIALPAGMLAIASEGQPVALAGVIGGADTRVTETTRQVLLEAANFDYISIRRSQSSAKIFTDASARFSRGVDPALTTSGIRRALALLQTVEPAARVTATGESGAPLDPPRALSITQEEVNSALGTDLSSREITALLVRAGLDAQETKGRIQVTVTSARGDIGEPCDLLEEVARLGGFDRMPETMPIEAVPMHRRNAAFETREAARDALVGWGLQELISYTMTSPEVEARLQAGHAPLDPPPRYVTIINPTTSERTVMRRSLVPGVLSAMTSNLRFVGSCHVFELGVVIHPERPAADNRLLPSEPCRVAIGMTGPIEPPSLHTAEPRGVDYHDLSSAVRHLLRHLHLPEPVFEAAAAAPFQPGMCARISSGGVPIGHAGALHPSVAAAFDMAGRRVYVADLDVDAMIPLARRAFEADPIPRYPGIEVDISLWVDRSRPAAELLAVAREAAGADLADVTVFDVYSQGGELTSVGLRLSLLAANRTLTTAEAIAVRDRVAAALRERTGATIRE